MKTIEQIQDEWEEAHHIPANHRGDDEATIGSFPCECSEDFLDCPNHCWHRIVEPDERVRFQCCKCRKYQDEREELKKLWQDIDQLGRDTEAKEDPGFAWALNEIKRIFNEAAERRKREGLLSNDEAWNEFFNGKVK